MFFFITALTLIPSSVRAADGDQFDNNPVSNLFKRFMFMDLGGEGGGTVGKDGTTATTSGTLPDGQPVPANSNNCNGKYSFTSPYNNFGDPLCDFDENKLMLQLQNLDPNNAQYWYQIAKCESGYNPNAYLAASASGKGAYGLFQMNPDGQGNGQYDAGNVVWGLQTSNAIKYNGLIGGSFAYWACAT